MSEGRLRGSSKWVAVAAFLVSAGPAYPVTIDDFSTFQVLAVDSGSSLGQDAVVTGSSSIGGTRDLIITRDATRPGTVVAEIDGTEPGIARLSSPFGVAGLWSFRYDGSLDSLPLDPTGLGGVDLTDGGSSDRLRFEVQAETALGLTILVFSDADSASLEITNLPASPAFLSIDVPFSDFSIRGGSQAPADFTNVGAILFSFGFFDTRDAPLSARFDSISTVPEPASVLLLAAGLAALALRSRGCARS